MEYANDRADRRRLRSPTSASSPSPGLSCPNDQLTLYSDRRLNKRRRREEDSPDFAAGQLQGHLASDNVARHYARVDYGEAHDLLVTDQHQGHHFEGGQAHDSARVHNGNHYGPVNNYHYPPNRGLTPDANRNQSKTPSESNSQNSIATAMESLSFVRMDNRQANIRKAYASTCRWIFEKPEYNNWRNGDMLAEHNGFFWIKSKPGAGKSTLMKFLVQSVAKQLPDDHVVSFFFNARGELLERSLEGLYRGLLHQLLTLVPRLQDVLKPQETASSADQAWPLDSLKALFGEAILKLGQDRVTCFIDALDECPEGEVRDMVEFFEELGESIAEEDIGFRVCFSSRHYPQVTMMKCQPMILDGQEGHEDDIARYVRSKLKVELNAPGDNTAEEVRIAVQAKAKGIFMWVVLVVRILNEESDRGSDNAKLRECLGQIPAELHNLFQDILQRGIHDNKYLLPILQWISFAQRPLTREELYFAVRSGSIDFDASQPWDPKAYSFVTMDRFILNASKGLAERTRGNPPTIQFIHESVRDYLRETGFAALAPELSGNFLGLTHDYLKRCCLSFITEPVLARLSLPLPIDLPKAKSLEAKGLRKEASAMFPFLAYATDEIVFHAELACTNGIDQTAFVAAISSPVWQRLASLFAIHETRRYPPEVSIARKFAYAGAANLLSSAFLENACVFGPDELRTALQAAIKSRNIDLVNVLLKIMKQVACVRFAEKHEKDLLAQAVKLGDTATFTALLEGGVPIPADTYLGELLSEISKAGDVQAICYLSARGANIPTCSGRALDIAITRGFDAVARVLIDLGVPLESCMAVSGQHPLVAASVCGWAGIVHMLITSGTLSITPDTLGTSLSEACFNGHDDVVPVLLDCGAPVNFLDHIGNAPLIYACRNNSLLMVRLLLENGADANLGDGLQTPIAAACDNGELEIVKALVDSGADPNIPRLLHEPTPLSLAFYSFTVSKTRRIVEPTGIDETFVRLLLSKSANPNVRCERFWRKFPFHVAHTEQSRATLSRTLIYAASFTDNAELLHLLFEKGADANIEGGEDYHGALMYSCRHGHEEVVNVLLANGTGVLSQAKGYYRRVVGEAVEHRRSRIVELLLTEGHAFRAQNKDLYSGSLRMALDKGYDKIAKILMDMGVEE
jgi:ankyrin repeat protein